jgi:predicted dehydrogenase
MEKVKLGVLGVSGHFIKRTLLPLKQSSKVELFAVASRDSDRAADAAEKYGIIRHFGNYDDLLNDPDIEMVFIPLPNHLHAEWIKKAADAGKHILCEKPIAMNAVEAADAVNYAAEKGVMLMEAFMYRFQPQWIRAKELCDVGEIGSIVSIQTIFSYNNPDPNNIRNIADFGGGALMDIGCYGISVPRFLLGREPSRAISLIEKDKQFNTDKHTSVLLDFGASQASLTVSTQTYPFQKVFIHGSAGNITIQIPFNTFVDVPAVITVQTGVGERNINFPPADQYGLQFDAFADSIRNNSPVPIPPEDAINNMKVIDAVFRSAVTGLWENIY